MTHDGATSSRLHLRPASGEDVPALADLAARTFPLACPSDMPEADMSAFLAAHLTAERFVDYLADPEADVLVADESGRLVGYTLTFAREPYGEHAQIVRERPSVELSKCYVDPAAHGSGTASALLHELVRRAVAGGARSLWLGVNGRNARAQRFYAKQGFVEVGRRQFTVGGRVEDDLVLERPLR